jgi:hypothetical protein
MKFQNLFCPTGLDEKSLPSNVAIVATIMRKWLISWQCKRIQSGKLRTQVFAVGLKRAVEKSFKNLLTKFWE